MSNLQQTFKIDNIVSLSFRDHIDHILQQPYSRYELMEWLFVPDQLAAHIDVKYTLNNYDNKKKPALQVISQHIIPYLIFQREMQGAQCHQILTRLTAKYPQEMKELARNLFTYEQYIALLRQHTHELITVTLEVEGLTERKAEQYEQQLDSFVRGMYWPNDKELKTLMKAVIVPEAAQEAFQNLVHYTTRLQSANYVHDLLAMSKTQQVTATWLAHICAIARFSEMRPLSTALTTDEQSKATFLLKDFASYEQFSAKYEGQWNPQFEVDDFVTYYATEPDFIYKIAADFSPAQKTVALQKLLRLLDRTLLERLNTEPEYAVALANILGDSLNQLDDEQFAKLKLLFNKCMTLSFMDETIIKQQQAIWLILIDPSRFIALVQKRYPEADDAQVATIMQQLLLADWQVKGEVTQNAYRRYWEYVFSRYATFRSAVLEDAHYIIGYFHAQGEHEDVWSWLRQNAADLTQPFTEKPMESLREVMERIAESDVVHEKMASWVKNPNHFEMLQQLGFIIVRGNHEGIVEATEVLKNSMLYELEDEMLTEQFEKYQFLVTRIGLKTNNGLILRRAKIKAQLQEHTETNLDDWLDSLENL